MKKLFLWVVVLITLGFVTDIKAQNLPLHTLEGLTGCNSAQFEARMILNGYTVSETVDGGCTVSFEKRTVRADKVFSNNFCWSRLMSGSIVVTLATNDNNYYLQLTNALNSNGYKWLKSEENNNPPGMLHYYSKGDFLVTQITSTQNGTTAYFVQVIK